MKATDLSLKIKGFLGIKKATMKFDKPLTIIQAENGSGKSSIIDGIRYVHGVPIRNTKAGDRERLSYNDDPFSIEWICNKKKLKGTAGSIPTVSSVEKAVGVSRKALAYCMDPAAFLLAGAKELKELFKEVLSLDMDWTDACIKRGCDKGLLTTLSSDMKSALAEAKERRADSKGGKGAEPEPPEDPDVTTKGGVKKASTINLTNLEDAIAQVKQKRDQIAKAHALATEGKVSEKERKAALKEMEGLQEEIDSAPDISSVREKLAESGEKKIKVEQEHRDLVARQKAHGELQKKFKEWMDVDFCGPCKKKLSHHILKEEGSIEALDGFMAKAIDKIAALTAKEQKLQKQIDESDTTEQKRRVAELQLVVGEEVSDEEVEAMVTELATLDERIKGGSVVRDELRDYQTKVTDYKLALQRHEKDAGVWDAWDLICKSIPEVEKAGVSAGLNPLRKIMKKHKVLEGVVAISDDLEITYDGRPVSLLSKAERFIVSLAPYLATLELFKFPFVLVDDGDFIVTRSLRARLQGVLMAIAKVKPVIFAQAQVAEETEKVAAKLSDPKGPKTIALYQVVEGEAVRVAG